MNSSLALPALGFGRPAAPAPPLPALRDELRLFEAAPNPDGSPAWVIQDPVNNRFFRIGWIDFELLLHWDNGNAATLLAQVNAGTPLNVTEADLRQLLEFLSRHHLLRCDAPADVDRLVARRDGRQRTPLARLLHGYLFFRIPLVRPQQWLATLAPGLTWLQTRTAAGIIAALTLLGLYLASRQWDLFRHTLVDHLTWQGAFGYTLALVLAKTLHELGHAVAATRQGVRVAHMGVAFLVMLPMLYTDTGESWRLKGSRQRLGIAAAGLLVELSLAGLATLAWSLTADGALRNGLFFLATTSWVLSLTINASPFMRFDGYYILCDLLDLPNLHERAGILAKTWLRRNLLGFADPWPENFSAAKRRGLIVFALCTWIYRLVVFLGIALLVYHFFFKALGALLMAIELYWFIAAPVLRELGHWWGRRVEIRASRKLVAAGLAAVAIVLLVLPLPTRVSGYGWLHAEQQQAIHAPFPARIVSLPQGREFKAGEVLFTLDSSLLGIDLERAQQMAQARERQMAGLMGLPGGEARRRVLASEKALFEAEGRSNTEQLQRLVVRAPFAGVLHDLDRQLATGVWVRPNQQLAVLVHPGRQVVDAYVAEADLGRIEAGQRVRVRLLADPPQFLDGCIEAVDVSRTTILPSPMLDAVHGGPIATVVDAVAGGQGRVQVARDALFRIRVQLNGPAPADRAATVRVRVEGRSASTLMRLLRRAASVIIRESGA